jgi:hypothetical protein
MAPVSEVSASQLPTFPAAVLKPISLWRRRCWPHIPFSNCSPFTPFQLVKMCKTFQLNPIKYSSLAEFVCVDGAAVPWCIRQSKTWSISTVHTPTIDLSKSSFLNLLLDCFLVRKPTLSGRNKNWIFVTYFESEKAFEKNPDVNEGIICNVSHQECAATWTLENLP